MTTASNLSEAVKSNFLDLDGGVMNGTISMDEIVSMKRSSNESYMQINGGSSWGNGASLELFGKDHTSKGKFLLWAHNGTDYSTMEGFPDGYLTWNNKQVVCVSTWRSGTSWYRKYSDGWIEQGGQATGQPYNGTANTSLITAFSDTNYLLMCSAKSMSHYNDTSMWSTKATTYFRVHTGFNASSTQSSPVAWYACGF